MNVNNKYTILLIVEDINEMFSYADKDKDGKISWDEFQVWNNNLKFYSPDNQKNYLFEIKKKTFLKAGSL